jgi:putative thioredoxin
MTQQPFSRPGAIDLSGLKAPAPGGAQPPPGGPATGRPTPPAGSAPAGGARSSYALDISEENLQSVLDSSVTAPVVLVFYSPTRSPESATMADDVTTATDEYDGRFLAGLVDIDAAPAIAQALQIPQVPLLMVILDGRPAAQPIPGLLPLDEIRTLLNQLA